MSGVPHSTRPQDLQELEVLEFVVAREVAKPTQQHESLVSADLDEIAVQFAKLQQWHSLFVLNNCLGGHGANDYHERGLDPIDRPLDLMLLQRLEVLV